MSPAMKQRPRKPAAPIAVVPKLGATPLDARRAARSLYWRGWAIAQIAEELSIPRTTVTSWQLRDKWDAATSIDRCEFALEERFCQLVAKEQKTGNEFKEIDLLGRELERVWRGRKHQATGKASDLNPERSNGAKATNAKKAKGKNLFTPDDIAKLEADFHQHNFGHQRTWWDNAGQRTRFLLKARQIGATWYFAREAFLWGLKTGNNQIFLSASRNQANIFRAYIVEWVQTVLSKKLVGNPLIVQRLDDEGAELAPFELHFLGTNYRTAQGYHGDVYVDEAFWIYGFEQLWKVASAMATHQRYRRTIFSTPSIIQHEAYPMWSGARFNRRRAKVDRVTIDISHAALKGGALGPDKIWRQIVTLDDAIAQGFNLVDRDELVFDYSADEFAMLFACEFIDDSLSMFPFSLMQRCFVDAFQSWRDFEPYALRPFGDKPVWVGYDPNGESGLGDDAALVVVAPPDAPGGVFRVLEKQRLKGLDFAAQAAVIEQVCGRYNVRHIAVDATGVGLAVLKLVQMFFPGVTRIDYSVETKTAMVLKAKNVISAGRLKFDGGWIDVAQAFLAIRPQITRGGGQVTYVANRAGNVGHADLAWAVMHALFNEPLDPTASEGRSTLEIC